MKILAGEQIAQADRVTMEQEPIESINLMERAAEVIAQWICNNVPQEAPLCFLIGKGKNGGDALAVARMLYNVGYACEVYLLFGKKELGEECRYNLERMPRGLKTKSLDQKNLISVADNTVIIDALLGSGAHGEITTPLRETIELINALECRVVAIDLPSGMLTEYGNADRPVVKATTTLALEFPKLAMMLPEAGECVGELVVLPIELDAEFMDDVQTPYCFVDEEFVEPLLLPRAKFGHKGSFGHALLVCGSEGMTGAAVLAAGAALRSGCGMLTVHLPREERFAIHATNPSAIVSCDPTSFFTQLPRDMAKYTSVGIGCGLGRSEETLKALERLLRCGKPMVIDADALYFIAEHQRLLELVAPGSILTPHIGELRRLVGEWTSIEERNRKVVELAARLSVYVIVKGAHTMTCTPQGTYYFNSTGNPGMAKAGAGDILTGLITGLLSRGYAPEAAAILGVYLHGKAGDAAAEYYSMEGMNSSDIIDFINAEKE